MLIPFGVFSAAGAGGGAAAGSYELISTAYGTGSSGTITFSSIPSTYKHLQIRAVMRTTFADTGLSTILIRLNSDSGSNYAHHRLSGNGSTVTSQADTSRTGMGLNYSSSGDSTANSHAALITDILDYGNTSKNTTIRTQNGANIASSFVALASGLWLNTAAVNTVTITTNGFGNWTTTSRFSLYGVK